MKRFLSIIWIMALLVTTITVSPVHSQAAKKAVLSTKTVSIFIGGSATIKISNKSAANKYSFSSSNKSLATVSTTGKIVALKKGTLKITVTEKYKSGKKYKSRSLGTVNVTVKAKPVVTPVPTAKPTVKPTTKPVVTATPVATVAPVQTPVSVNLSTTYNGTGTYDAATGYLAIKDTALFQVDLPKALNSGEKVHVDINGTFNGDLGFRCWLSDEAQGTLSNQVKTADLASFAKGEFSFSFDLTSTAKSPRILIKGPAYGTNIDNVVFKSIKVTYVASSAPRTIPDPYSPAIAQAFDLVTLTLPKAYNMSFKSVPEAGSMIETQRFMADPTCVEYNGRLYVYGTTDQIEFDGDANAIANAYNTNTLSYISTSDMINWKDEGIIDVKKVTTWATKSWAPSVVSKVINGKTKFFLYFTNGGDGIGVLSADSPAGPWVDPINKRLISRDTPNCSADDVPWLFDPGALVDTDGTGYIYFGGGKGTKATDMNPKSARVSKLGADMTSLATDPKLLDSLYMFEDNEINKIGNTYYYSYCTNWSVPSSDKTTAKACIAYYTADNPMMDNWTYHGTVFENPGNLYDNYYNNHHHMLEFKGKYYILYHTTGLETILYGSHMGYRNLHIGNLTVTPAATVGGVATLSSIPTYDRVTPTGTLDPYVDTNATTVAWNAGTTNTASASLGAMVLDKIHTADWIGLGEVAFGTAGATKATVKLASTTTNGSIEIYLDSPSGTKVGTVPLVNTGKADTYAESSATLTQTITGNHKLYFVFRGTGYTVASWKFVK